MLPFVYLRLKRTDETDYVKPFVEYVPQHMGDDPSRYEEALRLLMQLRNSVRDVTKDMTGIRILWKYRVQLESLDLRLPNLSVPFVWYDSFTGEPTLENHLNYEKACILFNIAALFSQVAEKQDRESDDGLKRAFHYFQCSGSIFSHIYDKFSHAPTLDLGRGTLAYLKMFMLAQAQECFLAKGIKDQRKPSILAKMASQAAYMYLRLYEELKERGVWNQGERQLCHQRFNRCQTPDMTLYPGLIDTTKEEKSRNETNDQTASMNALPFEINWLLLMHNKFLYYTAIMLYYAALDSVSKNETGEAIARLEKAESYAKESQTLLDYDLRNTETEHRMYTMWQTIKNKMTGNSAQIQDALRGAIRDNDFIYHQKIPSGDTLVAVERLDMTQVLSLGQVEKEITTRKGPAEPTNEPQNLETDLIEDYFKGLMPIQVHEKASLYSEEKAKIFRDLGREVEESIVALDVALDSMGMKSVFDNMKKSAKFGKKPEGLLVTHLISRNVSFQHFPSFGLWEMAKEISREERLQPMELTISEIRSILDIVGKTIRDCREVIDQDEREYQQGKVRPMRMNHVESPGGIPFITIYIYIYMLLSPFFYSLDKFLYMVNLRPSMTETGPSFPLQISLLHCNACENLKMICTKMLVA
jgi:hypothetical protein